MIKIAICDDEDIITYQIEEIISEICNRENIPFDCDIFYSGRELEKEVLNGTRYDLIYLDIQMSNVDGISAAESIRKKDENVLFIYVSGYDRYMIELFRLDVFAFIRKPIEREYFEITFLEANRKICNQKHYYSFYYKNEEYKVLCIDILYFESRGRTVNVHVINGAVERFNGKLSEVESYVNAGKIPFLRVHQSYLVNYHHIKSRTRTEITLTDGTVLPISEGKRKIFGEQYSRLLGGEIDV